jgi:hypothetical protein
MSAYLGRFPIGGEVSSERIKEALRTVTLTEFSLRWQGMLFKEQNGQKNESSIQGTQGT